MIHAHTATQGSKYQLGEKPVIAMQSGHVVTVREILDDPWIMGQPITVKASWLKPLPMKYYGETTNE